MGNVEIRYIQVPTLEARKRAFARWDHYFGQPKARRGSPEGRCDSETVRVEIRVKGEVIRKQCMWRFKWRER